MPGISGSTNSKLFDINESAKKLIYNSNHFIDNNFADEDIKINQVYWDETEKQDSFYSDGKTLCWVDGEIYNTKDIARKLKIENFNTGCLFCKILEQENHSNFLSELNGEFSVTLYNTEKKEITIVTDRFGIKPVFINTHFDKGFFWTSDLKGFYNFTESLTIDKEVVNCFLKLGHHLENRTWFKEIELIPASTVVKYNIKNKQFSSRQYWSWNKIKKENIDFETATEETGRLLINAVNSRIKPDEKYSVALSGGLDSRAIFSALPRENMLNTFTFGSKKTPDVEIARKVSALKNVNNVFMNLNQSNWFEGRIECVWRTDGAINLCDLHQSPFINEIESLGTSNFDGFIGDLVCGGSWLSKTSSTLNESTAFERFDKYHCIDDFNNDFFNINNTDSYFINTRARRFTYWGTNEAVKLTKEKRPFLDIELIKFIYSLPDEFRVNNKLYKATLLNSFYEYFTKVEWQKTGLPLNRERKFHHKVKDRINLALFGKFHNQFVNYSVWSKEDKIQKMISKLLNNKSLLLDYVSSDVAKQITDRNFAKKIEFYDLSKFLTFEIWLRLYFHGYKNVKESFAEGF